MEKQNNRSSNKTESDKKPNPSGESADPQDAIPDVSSSTTELSVVDVDTKNSAVHQTKGKSDTETLEQTLEHLEAC